MKSKKIVLVLVLVIGIILGGFIGEVTNKIPYLTWLSYGQMFGIEQPIVLDFSVFSLTFGFMFKLNIASIIGLLLAIVIYKWMK